MIYVIIYLIGCIIAGFLGIKYILGYRDYELNDIPCILIDIVLSWALIFSLIICYITGSLDEDTVLFKHKKKWIHWIEPLPSKQIM